MAHPNADLVRKGFEAFAAGDMATLDAIMSDDVVWHASGAGVLAGDFVGKQAVFGSFALIPKRPTPSARRSTRSSPTTNTPSHS